MGKIWGTVSLNDSVYNELGKRGKLLSSDPKTPQQLEYMHGNCTWARLQSGINVNNSDALASKCILVGGTLYNGSTRAGFGENGAYREDSVFGQRPMPGITSISVKNKDTWGAVLEATVNFKVWSIDDLFEIDKVYFRPGFSACLEWGWTLSIEDDGSINNRTSLEENLNFLDNEKFYKKVEEASGKRTPNSEILVGYITNFSYKFQKNGSYDCSVRILSPGAVLEGLKISAANGLKYKTDSGNKDRENDTFLSSMVTAIVAKNSKSGTGNLKKQLEETFLGSDAISSLIDENDYVVCVRRGKEESTAYLRLETLLNVLNTFNLEGEKIDWRFATHKSIKDLNKPDVQPDTYDNDFTTIPGHFSLNPSFAVLPGSLPGKNFTALSGMKNFDWMTGDSGKIWNIWVSLNGARDIMSSIVDQEKQEFSFIEFIKAFLAELQKVLGNLNSFDIGLDDKNHLIYIVDRNNIKPEEDRLISVSGLNSCVRDITIESEISENTANMMSVAAQGSKNISPVLTSWNADLTERHKLEDKGLTEASGGSVPDTKPDQEAIDTFWENVEIVYRNFFEGEKAKNPEKNMEKYGNNLQLVGEAVFMQALHKNEEEPVGIFPVKVSLTFQGIAGWVVGECFGIEPGILPKQFNNWNFIVTGVEQQLDVKGWTTTVNTQYFPKREKDKTGSSTSSGEGGNNSDNTDTGNKQAPTKEETQNNKFTLVQAKNQIGPLEGGYVKDKCGNCANFTGRIAALWQTGKDPGHVGGDAWSDKYSDFLKKDANYSEYYSKQLKGTSKELAELLNYSKLEDGTVLQYYTDDLEHTHFHSCIKIHGTWYSDYRQLQPIQYQSDKKSYNWVLKVFKPNDRKELA